MAENPAGRISERFKLGRVIKASASSTVYLANEAGPEGALIVKILGADAASTTDAARSRFQHAVATIGALRLPGFPSVLETGWATPTEGYVVMVPTVFRPLADVPEASAIRITGWIARSARALDALHLAGVAHLNVRPDNIAVTGTPEDEGIVLFGLGTGWLRRPPIGDVFSAPELGQADATPELWRCDLYSLARTACALLGLTAVSEGRDGVAVGLPDHIRKSFSDPEALRVVIERALDNVPARRPSSLSELARELDRAVGAAASGQPRNPGKTQPVEVEPVSEPTDYAASASPADAGLEARTVRLDGDAVAGLRGARSSDVREGSHYPPATPTAADPAAPDPGSTRPRRGTSTAADGGQAEMPGGSGIEALHGGAETPAASAGARELRPDEYPVVWDGSGRDLGSVNSTAEVPLGADGGELPGAGRAGGESGLEAVAAGDSSAAGAGAWNSPTAEDELDLEETPPAPIPLPPLPEFEPEPEAVREGAPPAPAVPVRPAVRRPGLRSLIGLPWVWVALSGTLVVFIFVVALATVAAHRRASRAALSPVRTMPTVPPPTEAPAVPQKTLADELEALIAAGEVQQAEQRLAAVPETDLAQLPLYERQRLATVRQTIAERHRWDLVRDLDRALARGDLDSLERTVGALSGMASDDQGTSLELQRKLSAARGLVELNRRLRAAQAGYRWTEVLENAKPLLAALPDSKEVQRARDEAATALEEEADALVVKGRAAEAREKLAAIERWWPERDGLQRRVAALDTRLAAERSARAAIASADEAGKAGHPDTGLETLAALDAHGPLAAEVEAARQRLAAQLATLDAGTPRVTIASGNTLEYDKNQTATVALAAEDDFEVQSVGFFARRKGGSAFVQFAAVEQGPGRYSVSIPLAFHQNETVQFYAIARDPSGHTGELGSATAPLELKRHRRGWFGR